MAILIKADGREEEFTDMSLESLQKAVGGYVEPIYLDDGRIMLCDEDGGMKNLPVNEKASELYVPKGLQSIVGDVIVCERSEME